MLVPYTFDLQELSIQHLDSATRKVTIKTVLPILLKKGIFIYSREFGLEAVNETFKAKFPDKLRSHMLMFLSKCRKMAVDFDSACVTKSENLNDLITLKGHCFVFSTNRDKMTFIFGIPDTEISHISEESQIEITPFEFLHQSEYFKKSDLLVDEDIEKGDRVIDVWNSRFKGFANTSKEVIIIDRYAASEDSYSGDISGLRRILVELEGASGQKKTVSIFTSYGNDSQGHPSTESGVVSRVEGIYGQINSSKRGGIREIKIYAADDREFMKVSHDRRIYFDNTRFTIGTGLEVFQDNYESPANRRSPREKPTGKVWRGSTCFIKSRGKKDEYIIKQLKNISQSPRTFVINKPSF